MKLHNSLAVIYETTILENGVEVSRREPKRNLLLDSGLDGIAARTYWDSFSRCVLGDGTTPTKRDSGAVTVTIAAAVATASAGYFEAADVGRLLKLDSGQEVKIDAFTSATEVSVTGAADDAASECTIWYVNETGHANELVRTSTLSADSGDVSSTWDGSIIELKRTFIFPEEVGARTYKEIGWSHTDAAGGNLFGRDLIPGAGDSIAPGQQYKVVVKLQITPAPIVQTASANVGTGGFDTSGDAILALIAGAVKNNGDLGGGNGILEPSVSKNLKVISADFALPAAPALSGNGLAVTINLSGTTALIKDAYVTGSFGAIWRYKLTVSEGNGTIYGLGFHSRGDGYALMAHKFTTPQVKDSDHTLELGFGITWGRTLTN